MATTPYDQVWEFHKAFGQPAYTYPALPSEARRELRGKLLKEEYEEYLKGESEHDLVQIADALADMTYIIYGTGIEYGLPMDALFGEVHRSNMSKLDPATGKPIYREDGKVMKPPSYSKPDLAAIIAAYQADDVRAFAPADAPEEEPVKEETGIDFNPMSIMNDFYAAKNKPYYPERLVVYVNIGDLSREEGDLHVAKTRDEFSAIVEANGDEAFFYFVPTRGEERIERL